MDISLFVISLAFSHDVLHVSLGPVGEVTKEAYYINCNHDALNGMTVICSYLPQEHVHLIHIKSLVQISHDQSLKLDCNSKTYIDSSM